MTKVGEGNQPPQEPSVQKYRDQIDQGSLKFLNALDSYNFEGDYQQKLQLKAVMDEQLALIRYAVNEVKRAGIYKQDVKVENDYEAYMRNKTPDNLSALQQDVVTLREYTKYD